MNRPFTTLFLLTSVDGKISTGDSDLLDVDRDYPKLLGIKEGLQQYYDIEKQTDFCSLNSGRVFSKIGFNHRTDEPLKTPVSFVIVDSAPHLNESAVRYLAKKSERLFLVTSNPNHPAFTAKKDFSNIVIIPYVEQIDFTDVMIKLRSDFGIERLTVQSGGTLNATLLRAGLIDRVLLVVAPALVGGRDTASLVDGDSLHRSEDLLQIRSLELTQAKPLDHSYLLLEYLVRNN